MDLRYRIANNVELWPIFDFIAIYGHILVSGFSVFIAIHYHVSVFMLLNLSLMCLFYMNSTNKLYQESKKNVESAGIMDQVDLMMASLVNKRYRSIATQSFLKNRSFIWRF
jgi:hypothetical protein